MRAYHYSVTYNGDGSLINDYHKKLLTAQPYIIALEHNRHVFCAMLLMGIYKDRLEKAEKHGGWFEYAKDATEAIFEFVRKREFPSSVSRLACVYCVKSSDAAFKLAMEDWGEDEDLKILEVEIDSEKSVAYDRSFYDMAYDAITDYCGESNLDYAIDCARRYFSGEISKKPVPEILCCGENKVIRVLENRLSD